MPSITAFFILFLSISTQLSIAWESLPQIPSGRRSQYLVLHDDGGYKYGYDTGDGSAAKQLADLANQVSGHYFYKNAAGQDVDLKYTAGVQGFVPEGGLEKLLPSSSLGISDDVNSGDASYSFSIDTDDYKRQESADAGGNVRGSFSYKNSVGNHDLSYVAGSSTGFQALGGSLSQAPGLNKAQLQRGSLLSTKTIQPSSVSSLDSSLLSPAGSTAPAANDDSANDSSSSGDASYSFSIDTDEYKRHETSDPNGNIRGGYSYKNAAGTHDLTYVAGSATGFLPTGGSLSDPNAITAKIANLPLSTINAPSSVVASSNNYYLPPPSVVPTSYTNNKSDDDSSSLSSSNGVGGDASYSFSIDTDEYKRQESADAGGNVRGSFSYKNAVGNHDLSYVAGSSTGFQPLGGSLSKAPGLNEAQLQRGSLLTAKTVQPSLISSLNPSLLSSAIKLSGSRAAAADDDTVNEPSSGDASYSFSIDTDEYKRHESADAGGNVRGSFSYKNSVGNHDLSYVAGSSTGFRPLGGSLSEAPGLNEAQLQRGSLLTAKTVQPSLISSLNPSLLSSAIKLSGSTAAAADADTVNEPSSGDASYSFSINTDEYKRHESADAGGNVRGSFSYKNSVGNHDLSYVAGSSTGFQALGGSLSQAPGLNEGQLQRGSLLAAKTNTILQPVVVQSLSVPSVNPSLILTTNTFAKTSLHPATTLKNSVPASAVAAGTTSYRLDDKKGSVVVHSYLPPNNEKRKYGYIFDTL